VLDPVLYDLRDDWPIDENYVPIIPSGLPGLVAACWERAGQPPPPSERYADLVHYVRELLAGNRHLGDQKTWMQLVKESENLCHRNPMAGVFTALCAVAAWHGDEDPMALELLPRGAELSGSWHDVLLPAIEILRQGGALWAARTLADTSIQAIEWRVRPPWPPRATATYERMSQLRRELEATFRDELAELAWAIREAIQDQSTPDRSRLAAAFWTYGDPGRAHALADTSYVPSPGSIEDMIDGALSRAKKDPFLGAVWDRIWWPGGALRAEDHPRLRRRSLTYGVYSPEQTTLHTISRRMGASIFAAYARALVAWFADEVGEDERRTIGAFLELAQMHPPSWVRIATLDMLITDGPNGPQRHWRSIAHEASKAAAQEHFTGVADAYDRFFDVPLHYVDGEADEVLYHVERHRRAGLNFWLWLTGRAGDAPSPARELLQEEERMVDEIRALRLVTQVQSLPPRLQFRHGHDLKGTEEPAALGWYEPARARARLTELHQSLSVLAERLQDVAPDYLYRRQAGATVEEFVHVLLP
jgi:hypothetical protein